MRCADETSKQEVAEGVLSKVTCASGYVEAAGDATAPAMRYCNTHKLLGGLSFYPRLLHDLSFLTPRMFR